MFKGLGGWIKEQLGFGLHPDELKQDGDREGILERWSRLRSWVTEEEEPKLYSWVLTHADSSVRGRTWIVEVGLKNESSFLRLSCVVKTEEISTLVDDPVTASQPRLVRYVMNNIRDSKDADFASTLPGLQCERVGEGRESYESLKVEVERPEREHAIVLVSPSRDGDYLVDPVRLQERLIGLAQVVKIAPAFNSYDMAMVLGEQRSAWSGAINILYAPTRSGFVHCDLLRSHGLEELGDGNDRISFLLASVTDSTNSRRIRTHIRPDGVRQLAQRRKMQRALDSRETMTAAQLKQALADGAKAVNELNESLAEKDREILESIARVFDREGQLEEAKQLAASQNHKIEMLKQQLTAAGSNRDDDVDVDHLVRLICQTSAPSPLQCLEAMEKIYSSRCVILPSATASAKKMSKFGQGRPLFDLLKRLVTEYRDKLKDGGDASARHVFGKNEYAAKESESVESSPKLRKMRTFNYLETPVEMFKHLKLGIDDDTRKTIRVHFHWDSERALIVIGYCGEHLPISSR